MKRFVVILSYLLVVINVCEINGFAKSVPQIVINDMIVNAGDYISVPIIIENNPGIIATCISVTYDKEILKLDKVENGSIFPSNTLSMGNNKSSIPYKVLWEDSTAKLNYTQDGVLVVFKFYVKELANKSITRVSINLDIGSTFDTSLEDVKFKMIFGEITIKGAIGDLNFDGSVNSIDALMALQYSTGLINLLDEQKRIGDTNFDNRINSTDALQILKYSTGSISAF